ncbi:uncharacterized protein N7506_007381 [Penicillium brevicompactum]|uniref:uncharacterized protein n=1 Tax=Penicillium brevicompactum TaxID=5074 RepID=UPI002540CC66|nr:uncharacterized protein N7506_007381 [Penicillium brevicompactum]KAJ5333598.1 hypothetical protein N7506_007381 [Penicillium brevicompactum]
MAALMKKFKKKSGLSTDLHARWGDVAISHPTHGSWNQWDQPSGFVANTPGEPSSQYGPDPRYSSVGSFHEPSPTSSIRRSRNRSPPERPVEASPSFPTGHFDHNIRHHDKNARPSLHGLGISDLLREPSHNASSSVFDDDSSSSCCDEDEEDRDGLGPAECSPRIYELADTSQPRYHTDDYDIPAKSPPLSVTSRMRPDSIHSYATAPVASRPGGVIHSPRTSYTAGSSVSAPFIPSGTLRYSLPGHPKSKSTVFPDRRHSRLRPQTPESTVRQEMVPSYDELYG